MRHTSIILFLIIGVSWCGIAQKSVSGTVSDDGGLPLPGVSIVEKGTQNGVITDFDGNYQISVADGAILVFSSVGFDTQEVKTAGLTALDLTLETNVESLSEVVVVGYGEQKKESVLSAIDQISSEELESTGTPNLANSLNGVSPGLNVVVETGQPGSEGGQIFIRGNANPLILVDGVEVVGGFANIDPRNVESVSILKDGAATAVYGVKGANGVIIITTKRGKIGPPKVSVTSELTVKSPLRNPDVLNAFQGQRALNDGILNDQAYNSGFSSAEDLGHWRNGDLPYIYPDTDWFDLLIKDAAISHNHTLSVRGGNDFVKYYASAGYLNEGDIFRTEQFYNYDPQFNFNRYSFRANLDFNLTKTTTLRTSIANRLEDQQEPNRGNRLSSVYAGLYTSAPGRVVPIYPGEVLEEYPDPLYPGFRGYRFGSGDNLYAEINTEGLSRSYKTVFNTDFELEQKLDFITKGLRILGKYNYVKRSESSKQIRRNNSIAVRVDTYTLERDGTWNSFEGRNYQGEETLDLSNEGLDGTNDIVYGRLQLFYNRSFGDHTVSGMALVSRNKRTLGTNYSYYNEDWVGRATYNYKSKYFAEFNGAYNGDETFANGYRFQFFPAYSVGYNMAKENFVKDNLPFLSNFKLRYSYGETGQKSGLGNNRWVYLSFYGYDNPYTNNRYIFGEDQNRDLTVIINQQLGNTELSWATVTKQNIGLDFGFFKQKLTGNIEFFNDRREGLIVVPSATVPSYLGTNVNLPFINFGESKSHGMEIALNYRNTTSYGLKYSIGGFYGFNENRVVKSAQDGAGTPGYTRNAGKPAGVSPLLGADGYFQSIDEVVNYPEFAGNPGLGDYRYLDYNANGTVIGDATEDEVRYNLPRSPQNSYSLQFSASYKGWSLSGNLNGTIGHKGLINGNLSYALPNDGNPVGRTEQLDYWTPDNRDAAYPALHATGNPNLVGQTARIINLDYLKLRSLNLGYNFNMDKVKNIDRLRLYANGNNLFTISDISFGDPEGNRAGDLYPVLRRINFGINVTF